METTTLAKGLNMNVRLKEAFLELLAEGVVKFSYIKKDGTLREAEGTRCLSLIPEEYQPTGKGSWEKEGYFRYFDFTCDGWRIFRDEYLESLKFS